MINIRKPTAKDIDALETFFQLIRKHTFPNRCSKEFQIGDYVQSVKEDEVWIVEENSMVIAFVSIYPKDNFVHNLFVHPEYQGKGIGKKLLMIAEEHLKKPMTLKVALDNPRASSFYEKYGWKQFSIHDDIDEPYALYKKT